MTTDSQHYVVSLKHLRQIESERTRLDNSSLTQSASHFAGSSSVAKEDFYQSFKSLPYLRISIQYNFNEFLTFLLSDAKQGQILASGSEVIGLQCYIHKQVYVFRQEHFDQMSDREITELLKYLKIDKSQLQKFLS